MIDNEDFHNGCPDNNKVNHLKRLTICAKKKRTPSYAMLEHHNEKQAIVSEDHSTVIHETFRKTFFKKLNKLNKNKEKRNNENLIISTYQIIEQLCK